MRQGVAGRPRKSGKAVTERKLRRITATLAFLDESYRDLLTLVHRRHPSEHVTQPREDSSQVLAGVRPRTPTA